VLRNAVLQTPLEREYAINERKLRIENAFRKERPSGWRQTQVIGKLKTKIESLSSQLKKTRKAITTSTSITNVRGAFVTFEEQPVRNAALELYPGGWGYITQPKARRFRSTTPSGCCDKGWRLRAFAPPHPRDVLHENLPYRLLRLDFKAFTTFCRRLIATALLVAFLLVSFGVIIGVNAAKMDPDALFSDLDPETKEIIVDSLFPLLASIILVVVNTSIAVMVSTLGEFERYPTLSGMHQNKAVTIFLAQAFNTGFVTLLLMAAPPVVLNPLLNPKVGFDPVRDFAPVAVVAAIPSVLVVHPLVPAKSMKELVALARRNPDKLSYGSGGVGSTPHLASELLKSLAGVKMLHVPYKSATIALTGAMSGEVDVVVVASSSAAPYVKNGRLRALAVLDGKRVAAMSEVPTAAEVGFPQLLAVNWYALLAPRDTPVAIVERLNAEAVKAINAAETRERLAGIGGEPMTTTPAQSAAFIRDEMARWGKVIRDAGVKAE
jgi:tripartite-type tricarboxylate transporter receptor subunit TctC